MWQRELLHGLAHPQTKPTIIFEDNQGCINISKNDVNSRNSKHMDIKLHYIRDMVNKGNVNLEYCHTSNHIADIMTKPLPRTLFEKLRTQLGIISSDQFLSRYQARWGVSGCTLKPDTLNHCNHPLNIKTCTADKGMTQSGLDT